MGCSFIVNSLTQILQNLCVGETASKLLSPRLFGTLGKKSKSSMLRRWITELEWLNKVLLREQQSHEHPRIHPWQVPLHSPPVPVQGRGTRGAWPARAGSSSCPGWGQAPWLTNSLAWPELTRFHWTKLWRNCDAALCSTKFIVPHLWPLLML